MPETRARFLANTIGATSASNDFTLPDGVGTNKQVLETDGAGGTAWVTSLTAPSITSVTGSLNAYEDGVSEDGGVLTINGTDFGADSSTLSVQISGTTGFAVIAETTTISITSSGTQFTATFTGAEANYNHSSFAAGSTVYVKVTKRGLQTSTYATLGTAMTGDPAFSTTSTTASTHTGTLGASSLGSYGGAVAGGGQDSNTKLLLNFDRGGGTDIEDSSNSGGNGHKVTASGNAIIKASPFGDGKSAMFFDGTDDYLTIAQSSATNADFNFGTSTDYTIEGWYKATTRTAGYAGILGTYSASTAGYSLGLVHHNYTTDGATQFSLCLTINNFTNALLSGGSVSARFEEWIHFALVRSGSTTSMYINGKLADSTTTSINMASSSGLRIGSNGTDNTSDVMNGYLDEIRIVNGSAVYTSDFDVPTSRLTAITNTKLLIHSDRHGALSPETGDRRNYISVTDVGPLKRTTSTGTASQLIDGNTTATGSDTYWFENNLTSGHLLFDFKNSAIVNKFTWIQAASTSQGQWTFSGSNDTQNTPPADSSFTALKTTFDLVSGASTDHTFTNTTAYRYYKLEKTGTGTTSHGPYTHEIQFFNTADLSTAFTDSSSDSPANNTAHTITATGSYHSQAHGGIAPAMTFPASEKLTGSAGVYFDGNTDVLNLNISDGDDFDTAFATGVWSLDTWCYMSSYPADAKGMDILSGTDNTTHGYDIGYYNATQGSTGYWGFTPGTAFTGSTNCTDLPSLNTWFHILMVCNWSGQDLTLKIYKNGVYLGEQTSTGSNQALSNFTDQIYACIGGNAYHNIGNGGSGEKKNWHGYLDNWRFSGNNVTADSSDPLYTNSQTSTSSNNYVSGLPTKIYGAYRSQDVGTIQLNASTDPSTTIDYAELSGGTALSTYGLSLSSSGAITGTLSGLADNSNSGGVIRIRARANADDNRVTTLGGSSFTGITQNDSKAPVLFNARRWWGTGVARSITGIGFKPDFVWVKERDADASNHQLQDSIRGTGSVIYSNTNDDADTVTDRLTSFDSDGFSISTNSAINGNNDTFIGWAFKAGSAPTATNSGGQSPTSGSVMINGSASTANLASATLYPKKMSINTSAGFSIVQYEGVNANRTIPHGLSQRPDFIIIKKTEANGDWIVWHKDLPNATATSGTINNARIFLNDSLGNDDGTAANDTWNNTVPTSEVVSIGTNGNVNSSGDDFIMYCFHAVSNVSAFGTYVGRTGGWASDPGGNNGGAIDVGFKPRFLIIKNISGSGSWSMWDTFRTPAGDDMVYLYPNGDSVEQPGSSSFTPTLYDDGFRFDGNVSHASLNGSGNSYTYIAFA